VHQARRRGRWPPTGGRSGQSNKLGPIIITLLVVFVLPASIITIIVVTATKLIPVQLFSLVFIGALLGASALLLLLRDLFVSGRIAAKTAAECWGSDAVTPSDDWAEPAS
jgi:hypothetical protein